MKKKIRLTIVILFLLLLIGVNAGKRGVTVLPTRPLGEPGKVDVALMIGYGYLEDPFMSGNIQGLERFAEENHATLKIYELKETTEEQIKETIDLAIKEGAQFIALPGMEFAGAACDVDELYPNTAFVLIDSEPHDENYKFKKVKNVESVLFKQDQSGYLAGYGTVKEGYTKLGFMGGIMMEAIVEYGYGFVVGADDAAREMGKQIEINYYYGEGFNESKKVEDMARRWFALGTQAIFNCGAGNYDVIRPAEVYGGKVIGVDIDMADYSDVILTSALKGLNAAVYDSAKRFFNREFEGGTTKKYEARDGGAGIPYETSRFVNFDEEDYNRIVRLVKADEVGIPDGPYKIDTKDLKLTNTNVNFIK